MRRRESDSFFAPTSTDAQPPSRTHMRVTTCTIEDKKMVGEHVTRLSCSNGILLTVHIMCDGEVNDDLRLTLSDKQEATDGYTMQGAPYMHDDTHTCISFGGLLCRLPGRLSDKCYLHVQRQVKRRRVAESARSSKAAKGHSDDSRRSDSIAC